MGRATAGGGSDPADGVPAVVHERGRQERAPRGPPEARHAL